MMYQCRQNTETEIPVQPSSWAMAGTLLTCIQKLPGSNLSPETGCDCFYWQLSSRLLLKKRQYYSMQNACLLFGLCGCEACFVH